MRRLFVLAAVGAIVCGDASARQEPRIRQFLLDLEVNLDACLNSKLPASGADRIKACTAAYNSTLNTELRAGVLAGRAKVKLEAGDFDGAIKDADQADELWPENDIILSMKCLARTIANRELDVARYACNRSIEIDPVPYVFRYRGLVGLREGRWQDAWNDFNDAVSRMPSDMQSIYGRGLAALGSGRTREADADFAKSNAVAAEFFAPYGFTAANIQSQANR